MKKLSTPLLFLLLALPLAGAQSTETLKIMSFNIWHGGGSGERWNQTVNTMRESGADIIGVQEPGEVANIATALGWNYVARGGTAILTRHNIVVVGNGSNNSGAKITTAEGNSIYVFNAHLAHSPYQPYQLHNIPYGSAPFIKLASQAVNWADRTHGHQVISLIKDVNAVKSEGLPIFVLGDFNEPSHLDWTKETTAAGLTKLPVAWPSTKKLQGVGFVDAFREIHPDPVTKPGLTWTTGTAQPERHDRIDFVLYQKNGANLAIDTANVVGEPGNAQTDIPIEKFPSDHRAVLVEFTLNP